MVSHYYSKTNKLILRYGEDCMEDYLNYLNSSRVNGTLYYFNGSGFDNFLHLKGMIDNRMIVDSQKIVKCNGKIFSFNHSNTLKVHDLCLFIKSSLKEGCVNWGVPLDKSKTEFDHDKVYDIDSALQHETEVRDYLKYDVISLAELFSIYHDTMWKCFSMDINTCMTPAQYAIKVWSSTLSPTKDRKTEADITEIYVPHAGKEEEDDRAAYYGGRVMCQYKEFYSLDYEEASSHYYNYDNIEDYLILGDVNSLYPAAQVEFGYAYGKWKYINPIEGSDEYAEYITNLNYGLHFEWTRRCMFRVDVQCPKDLLTSFLMARDSHGNLIHSLDDKVDIWYWGTELDEAQKLGYVITKIYEIKEFEKFAFLFKDYVMTCWEGRQASKSKSAKNLAFKFAMNSLTGKFGQKSHPTSTSIYNCDFDPKPKASQQFEQMIDNIVDFIPMFNQNGENNCLILETLNANRGPTYPIYLSAQILANSRVIMSSIMRDGDCYRNRDNAIYYTDTDSIVIPPGAKELLEAKGHFGTKLGQIKCDLNPNFGNPGRFAKIVRAIWGATKGPYSLVFVLPDDHILTEKVKMKGIPHTDKFFKHHDDERKILAEEEKDLFNRMDTWLIDPLKYKCPADVISKRFYLFKTKEQMYFAGHVNFKMIKKIMKREGELYAFFGTMKKSFYNDQGSYLSIKPSAVKRSVGKSNWWEEGKHRIGTESGDESLTYPLGYQNDPREFYFRSLDSDDEEESPTSPQYTSY